MSLRILLFWIIGILLLWPHHVDGLLSMENFFQQLTQASAKKQLEPSWTIQWSSNLYQHTLDSLTANTTRTSLKSISDITQHIKDFSQSNNYKCTITNNDTFTILAHEPAFLADLYLNANVDLWQKLAFSGDLRRACETALSCLGVMGEDDTIRDNTIQLQSCKSLIFKTYTHNSTTSTSFANIPLKNNSNNLFIDNNKENGLFDLFIDIQHIEALLFNPGQQWPTLPKMIWYTLPNTQHNTNDTSHNTTNNPQTTRGWSSQTESTNQRTLWARTSENNTPISTAINDTITTPSLDGQIQDFITAHTLTPQNANGKTYISPQMCLPTEQPWLWIGTVISGGNTHYTGNDYGDAIDGFTKLQDELINAINPYLYGNQWAWSNTAWFGQNFINPTGALPQTTQACKTTCADSQWLEKMICEGKCCMNACNQTSDLTKRALCLSQCLCGEASVANDMLRIKICRVPAQQAQVSAGKTITSIEQAVEEINTIFSKLKQNGALIKRTKTTEFLDSSFSSIKLHKVLAFDIFVVVKPIYDILDMNREKDNIITTHNKLALLNHTSGTLGKWADKNKYNTTLVGDTTQLQKQCQQLGKTYNTNTKQCETNHNQNTPNKNNTNNSTIINNLSTTHSITTTNDMIAQFLKDHYQFWQETAQQINALQISTANLRAKAEQAK